MGYSAKIQQITRKDFNQCYINFPRPIALAINFSKGDIVEWEIVDKDKMGKRRRDINRTSLRKTSAIDPDATLFYKAGIKGGLSYKAHITTETNGIITAVAAFIQCNP